MTDKRIFPQEGGTSLDEIFDKANDSQESEQETKLETKESSKEKTKEETKEEKQSQKLKTIEEGDDNQNSTDETPTSEKKENWKFNAVKDERRKRQELEKKLAESDIKYQELLNQKAKKEKAKRPDSIEDPEGASEFDRQENRQEIWEMKVNLSQDFMRDKHEDYDEMEKKFQELAENNVHLSQQLRLSSNPAKFAYKIAKAHIESQNFKNPDYIKNLKEEIKKEILAEFKDKQNTNSGTKSNVKLPISLTNMTSVASNLIHKEPYDDSDSLKKIFGDD